MKLLLILKQNLQKIKSYFQFKEFYLSLNSKFLRSIFLTAVFILTCQIIHAQQSLLEKQIEADFNDKPVQKVFEEIEEKTSIKFAYNSDILPEKKITYNSPAIKVIELLDSALNTDSIIFSFEEFENHIIILKNYSGENLNKINKTVTKDVVFISGTVIDKFSKEPIPYAHIFNSTNNFRTITNQEGIFVFKIAKEFIPFVLEISFIGYETYRLLINNANNDSLVFELKPITYEIEQVIVKPVSAIHLVNKAIEKIPDNYSKNAGVLTTFFRETNKLNNNYINISEAILLIYKTSYGIEYNTSQVKIIKARKDLNKNAMAEYDFKVAGGLNSILKLDIVQDRAAFLNNEFINQYNFEFERIVNLNERPTYLINFNQNDNSTGLFYQGVLYIDIETLAITGAEFQISEESLKSAEAYLIRKKPNTAKIFPVYSFYKTEYVYTSGIWHLNNAISKVTFNVLNKKTNNYSEFTTTSEFIITNRESKNIRKFKRKEITSASDIFIEQIPDEFDEGFWGKYNIIQPDKSLKEAYKELKKGNILYLEAGE